ncbi:excinuclease ABC subunit UvrC [Candidatus Dojkabacteria bacterium]|uniref:Excinuclease ABC subunit UvrC n=1 Tax=Candidatus Dojkabacteria bacterium TaxID=2099670 RepID=A0A955LB30_9BACT|nr:excinuclease ABC subunit UvrC [Candidatus Dojkabacteria bacterium]
MSKILESKTKSFQKAIAEAPLLPGCYIYKNRDKEIIYIGKAKKIRNRVKSYFTNYEKLDERIRTMIEEIHTVEFLTVDTEVDALILESNLIKKYEPRFNIMLRDDKSYIYVRFEKIRKSNQPIPKRNSVYQDFPRVTVIRNKKDDGAEYFGPYPDSMPAKRILKRLRRLFPYRTSRHLVYQVSDDPLEIITEDKKPCFYYHIGLCNGACAGLESKEHYQKSYKNIRKFFLGEKKQLLNDLDSRLKKASAEKRFEDAAKLRDRIRDINYVTANINVDHDTDDVVLGEIKRKRRNEAVSNLVEALDFPSDKLKAHKGFRIECYDISNIQGTNAVGSMVVMIDGEIKPQLYRRFKIQMKNEPNDFAMLQEVLTRRFRQYLNSRGKWPSSPTDDELPKELWTRSKNWKDDESFSQKPDLIIIDGGKGQLASTYKILYNFGLHNEIPMVGLAKREEEIFKLTGQFKDDFFNQVDDSSQFKRILLPRRSQTLFMVQRLRDEAHRFAITYHRNLRSKKLLEK